MGMRIRRPIPIHFTLLLAHIIESESLDKLRKTERKNCSIGTCDVHPIGGHTGGKPDHV